MILTGGKTEVLADKPVTMPLHPPDNPHELDLDRTQASKFQY